MRFDGIYIGRVVGNNDPEKLGRTQVRVPQVYGPPGDEGVSDSDIPWAIPSGFPNGSTRSSGGFAWVPEIGDQVVVQFLDGDPEMPVYTYAMATREHAKAMPTIRYLPSGAPVNEKRRAAYGHEEITTPNRVQNKTTGGVGYALVDGPDRESPDVSANGTPPNTLPNGNTLSTINTISIWGWEMNRLKNANGSRYPNIVIDKSDNQEFALGGISHPPVFIPETGAIDSYGTLGASLNPGSSAEFLSRKFPGEYFPTSYSDYVRYLSSSSRSERARLLNRYRNLRVRVNVVDAAGSTRTSAAFPIVDIGPKDGLENRVDLTLGAWLTIAKPSEITGDKVLWGDDREANKNYKVSAEIYYGDPKPDTDPAVRYTAPERENHVKTGTGERSEISLTAGENADLTITGKPSRDELVKAHKAVAENPNLTDFQKQKFSEMLEAQMQDGPQGSTGDAGDAGTAGSVQSSGGDDDSAAQTKAVLFTNKSSMSLFDKRGTALSQTFKSKMEYAPHHWLLGQRVEFQAAMADNALDAVDDITNTYHGNVFDEAMSEEGFLGFTAAMRMKLWAKGVVEMVSNRQLGLASRSLDIEARVAATVSTPAYTLQGYTRGGLLRVDSVSAEEGAAPTGAESYVATGNMYVAAMRQRFRDAWTVDGMALAARFNLKTHHTKASQTITREAANAIADAATSAWSASAKAVTIGRAATEGGAVEAATVEVTSTESIGTSTKAMTVAASTTMGITVGTVLTVGANSITVTGADSFTCVVGGTTLAVSGAGVSITGNVTVTGDVVANGVSLLTHLHGGVDSGTDVTKPPIPA